MSDGSHIEWTDATWNPITGCSIVSPGCTHCYAMKLAGGRLRNHPSRKGLTQPSKAGPVWTGEVRFNPGWLTLPLRWATPRDIFVVAHGDLFHQNVPTSWIDQTCAVMALGQQHRYQVLTKRPGRMADYLGDPDAPERIERAMEKIAPPHWCSRELQDVGGWPLRNVLWGTSVERQPEADQRREALRAVAACTGGRTFVSYEPALGPIDWTGWDFLSWLISGGESGPRPSHPDWHRAARDYCTSRGIAYFFKQWGSWQPAAPEKALGLGKAPKAFGSLSPNGEFIRNTAAGIQSGRAALMINVGKKAAGRELDGRAWDEMPMPSRQPLTLEPAE